MDTLGSRIRIVRGDETQEAFSAKIGVSKGSLGGYERDENSPSADAILKICSGANISVEWLMLGVGTMRPGDQPEQVMRTPVAAAQGGEVCERCRMLEEGRWQLSEENRQLLKDNGALKLENLTLTHQLDESRRMRHELERRLQAVEEGVTPFTETQIIPPSEMRPR